MLRMLRRMLLPSARACYYGSMCRISLEYGLNNHISLAQTGAHFTSDFSIVIKIQRKFNFTVILFAVIISLQIFAHVATA